MQTTRQPLRRSRSDALVGGVAGGVAAWLKLDPALLRLGWLLLSLFGGVGVLLYFAAWAIVPDEEGRRTLMPLLALLFAVLVPVLLILSLIWPVTVTTQL